MRLIKADEFKNQDILGRLRTAEFDDEIEEVIKEIPTAYDLYKIIERLKENEEDAIKAIRENAESEFSLINVMDLQKLFEEYTKEQIEIVKSGGVSND